MSKVSIFLAGCTTMAAALAAVVALTGATAPLARAEFAEITVGRINIVEPDGTTRMIVSNRAQFPGDFYRGKEAPRPDRRSFAGMIFLNDEGTESGGFIHKGGIDSKGNADAGMSLTFDRFRQDQAIQLLHAEGDGSVRTAVMINDVPDQKIHSLADWTRLSNAGSALPEAQQAAYFQRLEEQGATSQPRVFLGTTTARDSALLLKDAKGRTRIRMAVAADGTPQIQMLGEDGKVRKTISADN